jgi:hypothetical protein
VINHTARIVHEITHRPQAIGDESENKRTRIARIKGSKEELVAMCVLLFFFTTITVTHRRAANGTLTWELSTN